MKPFRIEIDATHPRRGRVVLKAPQGHERQFASERAALRFVEEHRLAPRRPRVFRREAVKA